MLVVPLQEFWRRTVPAQVSFCSTPRATCTAWRAIDSAVRFVEDAVEGKASYKLDLGYGWRATVERLYTEFASEVMGSRLAKVAEQQPVALLLLATGAELSPSPSTQWRY